MEHLPALINDLALILVLAGIVTLIFKRLRQPLVLGYIVAGFLAGPHLRITPTVTDAADIQTWADIGVIFLMFTLGIEFSFKKIVKMGAGPVIAAVTIISAMSMLGSSVGHMFGWGRMDSLFLGGMLAMSSTTIIYKAFDDMKLRSQKFAEGVLSVLVLEDILGILLMVILSTLAASKEFDGMTVVDSLMRLLFYLSLLFLVGVFVVPLLLRKNRKWMSRETLLIVSVGLCFAMVVLAVKLGYSAAFGAFMMGSIFAETLEADMIEKLISPVKDMFGAVFFVSVGMLVDPAVLREYWLPIVIITLAILVGQAIFGSVGFLLSGCNLKDAMQSGFSMAQIGEFAFIIASLGTSLHVTGKFLYPIVVAVSVITTFLTPYMIKGAPHAYRLVCHMLPARLIASLDRKPWQQRDTARQSHWRSLLSSLVRQTLAYSVVSIALMAIMLNFFLPLFRHIMTHWIGNAVCALLTIALLSPFLRAIIMRKNHSEDYKALWYARRGNRKYLALTIIVRFLWASTLVYYVINYVSPFPSILHFCVAMVLTLLMMRSRHIKLYSIAIERIFFQNLRSRDLQAEVHGKVKPLYASKLLSREIHLADLDVPENTAWAGQSLAQLDFSHKYGVMVASILRGGVRHNIPAATMEIYPGDRLEVIGSDDQLKNFAHRMSEATEQIDFSPEKHEMVLKCISISPASPICGMTVADSGIRERYRCMIVGFEEGNEVLGLPSPSRRFRDGDLVWLVGEKASLRRLIADIAK